MKDHGSDLVRLERSVRLMNDPFVGSIYNAKRVLGDWFVVEEWLLP